MTDTPRGSQSGRLQGSPILLPDVPDELKIHSASLVTVSPDKRDRRGWTGDRGDQSKPPEKIPEELLQRHPGHHFMRFWIKPDKDTSKLVLSGVQWIRSVWPDIPADDGSIEYLLLKTARLSSYVVPGRPAWTVPTVQNGFWYWLRLEDLQEVRRISARDGHRVWEIQVNLLSTGSRSTTVELLARKAD